MQHQWDLLFDPTELTEQSIFPIDISPLFEVNCNVLWLVAVMRPAKEIQRFLEKQLKQQNNSFLSIAMQLEILPH